jgi:hypothetical protein
VLTEIDDDVVDDEDSGRRRLVIVLGAVLGTAITLTLVLLLGSWGYTTRTLTYHRTRLERLVDKRPAFDQVVQALEGEGSPLLASPESEADLRQAVAALPEATQEEIVRKATGWASVGVFRSGEVIYVLFFDSGRVLRDFVCTMG